MKKYTIIAATILVALSSCKHTDDTASYPQWLESDSVKAIDDRIAADFTLSKDTLAILLAESYENFNAADIDSFTAARYLESRVIDGRELVHR